MTDHPPRFRKTIDSFKNRVQTNFSKLIKDDDPTALSDKPQSKRSRENSKDSLVKMREGLDFIDQETKT